MFLFEKMEGALKRHHEQSLRRNELDRSLHGESAQMTEKGDVLAMLISAFMVIVPVVCVALLVLVGVPYLLLMR